jgi:prenyltransferase beta subunit
MKKHECPQGENVAAFVGGELPSSLRGEFENHLIECDSCRDAVGDTRRVITLLKGAQDEALEHDLAPGVMIRLSAPQGIGRWRGVAAVAAGVTLLIGGALWLYWPSRTEAPGGAALGKASDPVGEATTWLCATQEPDGSWSTSRWGGHPQFEVALTGLSLMALLETETPSVQVQAAIHRATDYLISRQDANGRIGPDFDGAPYNQGIATLALVRGFQMRKTEALHGALDRALRWIEERQHGDGGWGYENTADKASNLSISLWQIEALRLAGGAGWTSTDASVDRGLKWMMRMVSDNGAFGYRKKDDFPEGSQTLTAMGAMSLIDGAHKALLSPERSRAVQFQVRKMAVSEGPDMDYYRRYFLAAALRKMGEESTKGSLVTIRKGLLARQVGAGRERGSWPADDRWSAAGGRVYATALASLSLK